MKDRNVQYPSRYQLVKVEGTDDIYDVTPAPGEVEAEGTLINKATLLSDETAQKYGYTGDQLPGVVPDNVLSKLGQAVLFSPTKYQEVTVDLSTAQEGDIVLLEEDGKAVEFYVGKLNYESALNGAGRVLLVRKNCYNSRWWNSSNKNTWASSSTLTDFLPNAYKNILGSSIQSAIGSTTYYYTPGNGNNTVTTRQDPVFFLSLSELGETDTGANTEGSALPIANLLKIAYLNGAATDQWTRTPVRTDNQRVYQLNSSGNSAYAYCNGGGGSRPVFTLPSAFSETYYVDSDGNIHEQQGYDTPVSTTDVQGNPIVIGTQIATGSYVGTGTYGASNPNTLTFGFVPKLVMIAIKNTGTGSDQINFIYGATRSANYTSNSPDYGVVISWGENSVSWYADGQYSGPGTQFNTSTTVYQYIALG